MTKPQFTRREFLGVTTAAALASRRVAAEAGQPPGGRRTPYNLLLFMPDTLRAESLGCYGHPVVRTPNIDRIAAEGARFDQCHVQNTVCGPSRCSMQTGWYVHVRGHRTLYHLLRPEEPSLFRYLHEGGYDVFWYGKNDLFATETFSTCITDWPRDPARVPPAVNPWPMDDPRRLSFLYTARGDRTQTPDYDSVKSGIELIEQHAGPFCLFLPLSFPHPPFSAPKDFHDLYKPSDLPPLRPVGDGRKPGFHRAIRETRKLSQLTDRDFRQIQAVYLGMITYTDWLLGEVLSALERTGRDKDTFVVICSDHGEWGGDYGLVEKWPSAVEDPLTRVPLIVRGPGISGHHVVREIVELFDLLPTCLELVGLKTNHRHFARSLGPQLRGESGDSARAAYCEGGCNLMEEECLEPLSDDVAEIYLPKIKLEHDRPETMARTVMVRTASAKLALRPAGDSELYDLAKDPLELHNVYADRSYGSLRSRLEKRVLEWLVQTSDVLPFEQDPRGFPRRGGKQGRG